MGNYGLSDSGLKSNRYPLKYMMRVYFFGTEELHSDDVLSCVIIKCPIVKSASFIQLTININPLIYLDILDSLSRNKYQQVKIHCWIVKNEDKQGDIYPIKEEDAFEKIYSCISINTLENTPNLKSPFIRCCLTLANPVLFYLQGTNGFNEILEDKTAFEALQKYESWLSESFGSGAFQFIKVGEDLKQNKWKYEQILTRNATDLMIPTILLYDYKLFECFGYYFFDDFKLDKEAKADITAYLINLLDKKKFQPFDVYDFPDLAFGLRQTYMRPIHDPFSALYQENPSVITKSREMQFGFRKAQGMKEIPQIKVDCSQGSHGNKDGNSIIKTTVTMKPVKPTEETLIYAPDDHQAALNRFDTISRQLRDDIMGTEIFHVRDTAIDYIQFNRSYNIDATYKDCYDYVPLSIADMFVRDDGKVPILVHRADVQFLRFRHDEASGRDEQKQYVNYV